MSPTKVHELSAFLNVLINDSLASKEYGGGKRSYFVRLQVHRLEVEYEDTKLNLPTLSG